MSRWFRHYAGMMRDEKLVRAAVKSKQPVERVVWVWGAILESAAEINDGGRFEFDSGEAAYFLRCDDADLAGILASLESFGRIAGGVVSRWGDRQYSSDAAAERQRRYRSRKAGTDVQEDNGNRDSDGDSDVTPPSRDGVVTAQETDTELETDSEKTRPPVLVAEARALFDEVWKVFPRNPTSPKPKAEAAFSATKAEDRPLILAAARARAAWFVEDCKERKRTETAGLRFEPHLSTWIEEGSWRTFAERAAAVTGPLPQMVTVNRDSEETLFKACERLRGKSSPSSMQRWSFPADIVAQARKELAH